MAVLRANYTNYELVLVDDGSDDDTVIKVASLLREYECVRLIRLSRRFGTEISIASGLETVIGDFAVVMLPESAPCGLIPEMVRRARAGHDVVFGIRKSRAGEPLWMRIGASIFYWFCASLLKLNLPRNATEFQVLSRRAVNAVIQIRDKYRYLRLLSAYVGFAHQSIVYDPIHRYGKPRRRGFIEAINLAVGVIITNSTHPLRLVSWLGVFASALNGLYIAYIVAINLLKFRTAEGWSTLSLQTAGMFLLVFMVLTVISEYVGRILDQIRERPLYYIVEEQSSPVSLVDEKRRNVVKGSYDVVALDASPEEVDRPQFTSTGSLRVKR